MMKAIGVVAIGGSLVVTACGRETLPRDPVIAAPEPVPTAIPTPPRPPSFDGQTERAVSASTVDTFDGVRCGVASIFPASYALPGWTPREGWAAEFWVERRDDAVVVAEGAAPRGDSISFYIGVGSRFQIGPGTWRVTAIQPAPVGRGHVRVVREPPVTVPRADADKSGKLLTDAP